MNPIQKFVPEDPKARKRLLKKVAIVGGVTAGVVVAAIIIRRLGVIETDVEVLVEIAEDIVEATEGLIEASDAILP